MTTWVAVVPVKGSSESKSRLVSIEPRARRQLALAFALDTVAAVAATPDVAGVVVVTADAEASIALEQAGAVIIADPGAGLNPAVAAGIRYARERWPDAAVVAVTADLPGLTTADFAEALELAALQPSAFVADAEGVGTTTITALPGVPIEPRFGIHSADLHAGDGLVSLAVAGDSTLRRDVDTELDLAEAARGGFGRHTAALLSATPR